MRSPICAVSPLRRSTPNLGGGARLPATAHQEGPASHRRRAFSCLVSAPDYRAIASRMPREATRRSSAVESRTLRRAESSAASSILSRAWSCRSSVTPRADWRSCRRRMRAPEPSLSTRSAPVGRWGTSSRAGRPPSSTSRAVFAMARARLAFSARAAVGSPARSSWATRWPDRIAEPPAWASMRRRAMATRKASSTFVVTRIGALLTALPPGSPSLLAPLPPRAARVKVVFGLRGQAPKTRGPARFGAGPQLFPWIRSPRRPAADRLRRTSRGA